MNISQLSAITKLLSSNPTQAKALLKLANVEVLKSLGDSKYSVLLENKTLTAQSDKPLKEGERYWCQSTLKKTETPKLSNLLKMPQMLKNFGRSEVEYTLKDLQTLLHSKKPEEALKGKIIDQLSNATTKEEFISNSNLLLSLQNNTFTIPINLNNYQWILQFKKRYNKKTKKSHLDFYAALEELGPISGIISLENSTLEINLNVAYEKTKNFLEQDMNNFSHHINISLIETIEPLYNANINSLLDINV